ncbi:MAG: hypothetical protein GTN81_03740 [Proteobacteria bacterium]|nr:hypothetical protein [Pseudomonadota bacterium]
MKGMAIIGLGFLWVAGCATPQVMKEASHQQSQLLGEFQRTFGELQTKVLEFYDEEIEARRQILLESQMDLEQSRVSRRAAQEIRKIDPGTSETRRMERVKEILDGAANYLAELPDIFFDDKYCQKWEMLKKEFLREPDEQCDDKHLKRYLGLVRGRNEAEKSFARLTRSVALTREAHTLVDEFLQIEFRLTEEQVNEAKEVMKNAREAVAEAQKTWTELRSELGGGQ